MALLTVGPAQSQDIFQTFLSIINENSRSDPRNPAIVRPVVDAELLQVQRQLAALGYDVGVPDGVMGPRTRQAIVAYQQSIGTVPTGTLTLAERDLLFGGGVAIAPPASAPPTGRLDFDLLHDIDLPGNDFRSGMSEPALKGLALDGCLAACAGDGRCQAFTYNARARVCFLKTSGTNPSAFGGAISGLRKGIGSPTGAPMAAPEGLRALLPAEVAQLQAGLNRRGYDAGSPDGVVGGRTRAAIASFLADNPGRASQDINVALMQAVLGQTSSLPPAAPVIDAASYRTLEEADRDLALIALARDNSLLDDRRLQTWFSRDARNRDFGDNFALITAYDNGNTVERAAILTRYRQTLIDEANAFVADPANLQFRIRLTNHVQFGVYEPGKGLAITPGHLDVLAEKRMLYRTIVADRVFGGLTLDAPDIGHVPVADQAAAAALINSIEARSGNRLGNITVWLTISEIGIDRNAATTPLAADIPMTVSIDKISLMTYGRDGKMLGEEIEVLYLPSDAVRPQSAPADNGLVASRLELLQVEGHLVVPGDRQGGDTLGYALGAGPGYMEKLARFLNLAAIRLNPDRTADWIEEPATRVLMTQGQHLRVYGKTASEFHRFANEFDRRKAMQIYSGEIVPELIAAAPSLPASVVSISIAQLGEYDFASGSFPIAYPRPQLFGLPDNLGRLRSTALYQSLPSSLAIDEATAEVMVRTASYGQPVVYVATFGTLSLPPPGVVAGNAGNSTEQGDPLYGALAFAPARAGIFADPWLTQRLLDLDPAIAVHDPEGPRPPLPPTATELALSQIAVTTELELLGHAYDRLLSKGTAPSIIESHRDVRAADEFAVAARRQEIETALVDASRRPVWLRGVIAFGTYRTDTGSFEAAEIDFYEPEAGGFSANYRYSLVDPGQLTNLPIAADTARQIVETWGRRMEVLVQVDLVDIASDAGVGTPTYQIALDINEMLILTEADGSSEPQKLVARVTPSSSLATAASQPGSAPPLRQLDPETLDYLRIKYAPQTMDDAAYERMMSARWAMEQVKWVSAEEHFFPAGTDLLSPAVRQRWLPDFKVWAQSRVASLSGPLRLACANAIGKDNWSSPLRDPILALQPDLAEAALLDRISARYATRHMTGPVYFEIEGYLMEAQVCGNGVAPYPLIEGLGLKAPVRSGAVIRLDNAVMPGTAERRGMDVDLHVVIDSVEMVAHPQGGQVGMLINARFDSAWYAGTPPVQAASAADLETLLAESNAATATPTPESWDIVGLRPGQSLEEADAIIRKHMAVAAVYERQQGQRTTPYFHNERSYIDATLSEAITLIYEPTQSGDVVFVIARQVGKPGDTMPTDDILAGLRAKYGPEASVGMPVPGNFTIRWHSQPEPRSSRGLSDLQHCGNPSITTQPNWTPIEGSVEAMDPSIVGNIQVRGYMVLPGTADLHPESLELGMLDCGVSIMASKGKSGNNDYLQIQMVDYAGYARAHAEAQVLAQQAAPTGQAGAPVLDIKF
ncbi:peptidoglycan-binding protein [Devosia sp. XGJD_8]|uniref:peptidoglycan-binding protein n=1 Tax=Devosia sp. XGJD_8 TaxID=3391187 RepID=UPI0039854277